MQRCSSTPPAPASPAVQAAVNALNTVSGGSAVAAVAPVAQRAPMVETVLPPTASAAPASILPPAAPVVLVPQLAAPSLTAASSAVAPASAVLPPALLPAAAPVVLAPQLSAPLPAGMLAAAPAVHPPTPESDTSVPLPPSTSADSAEPATLESRQSWQLRWKRREVELKLETVAAHVQHYNALLRDPERIVITSNRELATRLADKYRAEMRRIIDSVE